MRLDVSLQLHGERALNARGGDVAGEGLAELSLITAHREAESDPGGKAAACHGLHVPDRLRLGKRLSRVWVNISAQGGT